MAEAEQTVVETAPALTEEATGIALHADGYPVNLRLRAERLSAAGETTDEAGHVTDDAIAEAGERLAALETEAERAEREARLDSKTHDELDAIAAAETVDLTGATTRADKIAAIEAARNGGNG